MTLRDNNGDELRLSGCTTGYPGEGPHGSMRLLIEEGCPVAHAMVVLSAATAKFVRRDDGWVVENYTLASAGRAQPESLDLPRDRNVDAQIIGRL